MSTVHLLDYVAGNVRSLVNAIEKVGYTVEWVREPRDIENAHVCGQSPQRSIAAPEWTDDGSRNSFFPE